MKDEIIKSEAELGKVLKNRRNELQITQKQLADFCSLPLLETSVTWRFVKMTRRQIARLPFPSFMLNRLGGMFIPEFTPIPQEQLEQIREAWRRQMEGPQPKWRTPIFKDEP